MNKEKLLDEESRRVAANFKRLRKQKNWTQYETSKQPLKHGFRKDVTTQYIGHIENCNTGLGKKARATWAQIFGVDVNEFLKPIDKDDGQAEQREEIEALKREVSRYSAAKIRRLRQIIPILIIEGDENDQSEQDGQTNRKKKTKAS